VPINLRQSFRRRPRAVLASHFTPADPMHSTPAAGERRSRRRWRIPPAYLRGSEPIEGAGILDEFPGAAGLLLWQCARDVNLWALTPPGNREGLFSADAEPRRLAGLLSLGTVVREVEEPLRALAAMLSHAPDTAPEVPMLACRRLSQWADARGATASALAFAQASALAVPGSARAALRVGQLARRCGEYARAEGWLQRAIVLARQSREREAHATSYGALGNLYLLRGNLPGAERCHLRALRIAQRHALISREAAVLHDLSVVLTEAGRPDEAMQFARLAAAAYGPHHPNLPLLVHDLAVMWVEQGRFSSALRVLKAVLPRIELANQFITLSNVVRAAGGAGDQVTFARFWDHALAAANGASRRQLAPTALLNLARGAASLCEMERAKTVAGRALHLAEEAGEHKTRFEAEALLAAIQSQEVGTPQLGVGLDVSEELDSVIAAELVQSLAAAAR
jgi:tetratricopeptide (TPR) repeat protein